ncbi:winged helix-turn-helix transcriptional regulator [Candidatus Woesearchaeota archaeon]|nr:winged helix-turn-helix transcriptional regulator [Candidatus Woesearchaeota archaeon]
MRCIQELPAEKRLHEAVKDMARQSGAKTLFAKVNAIAFFEPEEISLDELAERTGYSLASISTTVREMERMGKLKRIKKPGSKKVYIRGEKNLIKAMHDHFNRAVENVLKPMEEILPPAIKELKQDLKSKDFTKEEKELLKKKIRWYEDYLEQNERVKAIFDKMSKEFLKHEQEMERQ